MEADETAPQGQPEGSAGEPDRRSAATSTAGLAPADARKKPIGFINHEGKRYLFPFDKCETWESFKYLLDEIYRRESEELRNELEEEKYDLLNSAQEIILPAVWDHVIENYLPQQAILRTISIAFWSLSNNEAKYEIRTPHSPERKRPVLSDSLSIEEVPASPQDVQDVRPRSRSRPRRVRLESPRESRSRSRSKESSPLRGRPRSRSRSTDRSLLEQSPSPPPRPPRRPRSIERSFSEDITLPPLPGRRARSVDKSPEGQAPEPSPPPSPPPPRVRSTDRSTSERIIPSPRRRPDIVPRRRRSRSVDGQRSRRVQSPIRLRQRSDEDKRRKHSPPYFRRDDPEVEEMVFERPSFSYLSGIERRGSYFTDSEDDDVDDESNEDQNKDETPVTIAPQSLQPLNIDHLLDFDGNKIIFLAKTSKLKEGSKRDADSATAAKDPNQPGTMAIDHRRILKAVQSPSEGRMSIALHTLKGPENIFSKSAISIHWEHLHGNSLDFTQFKRACMTVPNLSDSLQELTRQTLNRIEEKIRVGTGGIFIEPGTVLRGDEKEKPEAASVIFSCIPYFDVQPPPKASQRNKDSGHTPTTLMQAYYPNEPVHARELEQAVTKFKDTKAGRIIYVPSIWMMTIGTHAIITCGFKPLSNDLVQSIVEVENDANDLGLIRSPENMPSSRHTVRDIRVTHWNGSVLLFDPAECETYFQMEQRIREIRGPSFHKSFPGKDTCQTDPIELFWIQKDKTKKVVPGDWINVLNHQDGIFLDLTVLDEEKAKNEIEQCEDEKPTSAPDLKQKPGSIPPFFQWPHAEDKEPSKDATTESESQYSLLTPGLKRSMRCLEQVEKAMITETLDNGDFGTSVERAFRSSEFYESLPERKLEDIRTNLVSLLSDSNLFNSASTTKSFHRKTVDEHCSKLSKSTALLTDTLYETLKLFVPDTDKVKMIRKVWGAMYNIHSIIGKIRHRCNVSDERRRRESSRGKFLIRQRSVVQRGKFIPLPEDDTIKKAIRECRGCRRRVAYPSRGEAYKHLLAHLNKDKQDQAPDTLSKWKSTFDDWILEESERQVEETNAGHLAVITQANEHARSILTDLRQLTEGVQNAEGQLSGLYTFPHELLTTLHRVVVLYLAVERSFHFTEKWFNDAGVPYPEFEIPFMKEGLGVLEQFYDSARSSIAGARLSLCRMVRSEVPETVSKRLSLGPEYVCSWFIRRLLVKPVGKSLTSADIYRDHISNLQFQVNDRPSKRLLRSIKLAQEELVALTRVNAWQVKLVRAFDRVLDIKTYQFDSLPRRSMYKYEHKVLESCLDNLDDAREDYNELLRRCEPLSETAKQWAEINEEDHGKAILVFTIVTVIFLPLSFVTSYLGMNTSDIRDMDDKQSLFWEIALPLTAVTMGTMLFIAYNGEELRGHISNVYRRLTGKQTVNSTARELGVSQRKHALRLSKDSSLTLDYSSWADEAEFAPPRPVYDDMYCGRSGYYDSLPPPPPPPPLRSRPPPMLATLPPPPLDLSPPPSPPPARPAPNVIIYNTTRMDNEAGPPSRIQTERRSRLSRPLRESTFDSYSHLAPASMERRETRTSAPEIYPIEPSLSRPRRSRVSEYTGPDDYNRSVGIYRPPSPEILPRPYRSTVRNRTDQRKHHWSNTKEKKKKEKSRLQSTGRYGGVDPYSVGYLEERIRLERERLERQRRWEEEDEWYSRGP